MKRKKILFVIDSLSVGGAERSLVSLLMAMPADRYDVDLMMVRRGGEFERYVPAWVRVVDYRPAPAGGVGRLRHLFWRLCASALLRIKRPSSKGRVQQCMWQGSRRGIAPCPAEYDVAIAYGQGFPTFYVAEKVRARLKYAWVNADIPKSWEADFLKPYYDQFTKVVVVADRLLDIIADFLSMDRSRLTVVYDILHPQWVRESAREFTIDRPTHKKVIVTAGRVIYTKNYPLAVAAAALLRDAGVDFKWYFVGGGDMAEHIRALIAENRLEDYVEMTGAVANPYPYMAAADVYVQTSWHEGFGLTVTEAKMLGRPIVCTDFEVVYDQLTDGVNGLITAMTPEAVAAAIRRLLDDASLRDTIKANLAAEEFTRVASEAAKVMKLIDA